MRDQAAGTLATIWAANDIKGAIAWTEQIGDDAMRKNVLEHLATCWGAIEPQKAMDWVATLPAGPARTDALHGALDSWAATDPSAMAQWIAKQPPGPAADDAHGVLGETLIDSDPSAAFTSAFAIQDASRRQTEVRKLYRYWLHHDGPAATAWLQNSAPPDVRAQLEKKR